MRRAAAGVEGGAPLATYGRTSYILCRAWQAKSELRFDAEISRMCNVCMYTHDYCTTGWEVPSPPPPPLASWLEKTSQQMPCRPTKPAQFPRFCWLGKNLHHSNQAPMSDSLTALDPIGIDTNTCQDSSGITTDTTTAVVQYGSLPRVLTSVMKQRRLVHVLYHARALRRSETPSGGLSVGRACKLKGNMSSMYAAGRRNRVGGAHPTGNVGCVVPHVSE